MIIASLPVLGTLATRIRFNYLDMQEQSFSFFSCITAPAASGKSFIRKPVDLLLTPINEQDAIEREKEQAYKEKLRASKNSKFQPEDPHACPRNNGVSISVAKLLQLLTYAEGKHLIGIGEQMELACTGALKIRDGRDVMGSLLALLPEEFVTADLIKLRAKKGMNVSVSSIKSLLHRWKKNRRIAQVGEGRWRRLE